MQKMRRNIIKAAGAASVLSMAATAGWLVPGRALATPWNQAVFEEQELNNVLKKLGAEGASESANITIKTPDIAENGSVVPVEITSSLPDIESIAIVAEKNRTPLVAQFDLTEDMRGFIMTRIKLGETMNVKAVVKAGGKVYTASREVKVTVGGCGG